MRVGGEMGGNEKATLSALLPHHSVGEKEEKKKEEGKSWGESMPAWGGREKGREMSHNHTFSGAMWGGGEGGGGRRGDGITDQAR